MLLVPLHQLLQLVSMIDVNLHFSTIRSTLGLVRCLCARFLLTAEANNLFSMLGSSSYPRLYVPSQLPRQTELNASPATLFSSGKMHEIVLDGTLDGTFQSPTFPFCEF